MTQQLPDTTDFISSSPSPLPGREWVGPFPGREWGPQWLASGYEVSPGSVSVNNNVTAICVDVICSGGAESAGIDELNTMIEKSDELAGICSNLCDLKAIETYFQCHPDMPRPESVLAEWDPKKRRATKVDPKHYTTQEGKISTGTTVEWEWKCALWFCRNKLRCKDIKDDKGAVAYLKKKNCDLEDHEGEQGILINSKVIF